VRSTPNLHTDNHERQLCDLHFNIVEGYKLLLLAVRGFAIVNVTRSVSASSAIQAFYDGIRHQPSTTFGNVKADVLADKDPDFKPANFCSMIRGSPWLG
jgi:hypothetical protein